MSSTQGPARWLAVVAVITLLAVFSWRVMAIVGLSLLCFAAFNNKFHFFRSGSPRCLKCGEPLKASETWCRTCGSASWTR